MKSASSKMTDYEIIIEIMDQSGVFPAIYRGAPRYPNGCYTGQAQGKSCMSLQSSVNGAQTAHGCVSCIAIPRVSTPLRVYCALWWSRCRGPDATYDSGPCPEAVAGRGGRMPSIAFALTASSDRSQAVADG